MRDMKNKFKRKSLVDHANRHSKSLNHHTQKAPAHQVEKQSFHGTYAAALQAMSDFQLHFQATKR